MSKPLKPIKGVKAWATLIKETNKMISVELEEPIRRNNKRYGVYFVPVLITPLPKARRKK